MIDLKAKPFCLDDTAIAWVHQTLAGMTMDEKIGQLFCPIGVSDDPGYLAHLSRDLKIGGLLFRAGKGAQVQQAHRVLQQQSKIPLFLCANVETGGDGIALDGTAYGEQMQIAATGDASCAYTLGEIAAVEGAAVGLNLALGPVVDLDCNYRNPITNVRTFGADGSRVASLACKTHRGLHENGLGAVIKHFPGDGVDDRDHHLLTSVNSLSRKDWDASYGRVYRAMIEDGVLGVMAGHIALPAYQERPVPATLSPELLQKLLRETLGFNGIVMTDATPMVGFCCAMPRSRAVPYAIEAGCDVFLFNKDMEEDFSFMRAGIESGVLSQKRLEEALTRILAAKAALGLHTRQQSGTLVPPPQALSVLGCKEHVRAARQCADKAVTLVKDKQWLVPVSPVTHRRVLLEVLGGFESDARVCATTKALLEAEGFAVTVYELENFETLDCNVGRFKAAYDLVLYVANVENISNKTVSRIHWHTFFGNGNNVPWFVKEVPAVFVSVGNPYLMQDVPMIDTFINAYFNSDIVLNAVVEKLIGKSAFEGKSPIDAFCGRKELRDA